MFLLIVEHADVDAYCIVSCERTSVRTSVIKNTSNPEWNTAAVFYRKVPRSKPVKIEVTLSGHRH